MCLISNFPDGTSIMCIESKHLSLNLGLLVGGIWRFHSTDALSAKSANLSLQTQLQMHH